MFFHVINVWAHLGPLFWALFSFFPYFFLRFLSFFLLFKFSFLIIFLFISSFFDFSMFFIFFFHFSEEKVSSFLFSCISCKYFFAGVSIRV